MLGEGREELSRPTRRELYDITWACIGALILVMVFVFFCAEIGRALIQRITLRRGAG